MQVQERHPLSSTLLQQQDPTHAFQELCACSEHSAQLKIHHDTLVSSMELALTAPQMLSAWGI